MSRAKKVHLTWNQEVSTQPATTSLCDVSACNRADTAEVVWAVFVSFCWADWVMSDCENYDNLENDFEGQETSENFKFWCVSRWIMLTWLHGFIWFWGWAMLQQLCYKLSKGVWALRIVRFHSCGFIAESANTCRLDILLRNFFAKNCAEFSFKQ